MPLDEVVIPPPMPLDDAPIPPIQPAPPELVVIPPEPAAPPIPPAPPEAPPVPIPPVPAFPPMPAVPDEPFELELELSPPAPLELASVPLPLLDPVGVCVSPQPLTKANVIAAIQCACLRISFIVVSPSGRGIAFGLINVAN